MCYKVRSDRDKFKLQTAEWDVFQESPSSISDIWQHVPEGDIMTVSIIPMYYLANMVFYGLWCKDTWVKGRCFWGKLWLWMRNVIDSRWIENSSQQINIYYLRRIYENEWIFYYSSQNVHELGRNWVDKVLCQWACVKKKRRTKNWKKAKKKM